MEEILEELRGSGIAALLIGVLLACLVALCTGDGLLSSLVGGFLETIGGSA